MAISNPAVVLERVNADTQQEIDKAVDKVLGGIPSTSALSSSRKIVVKLNLCKPFPADSGATVDPRVTESVVRWILNVNPGTAIYLVESDTARRTADEGFEGTGHTFILKKYSTVHFLNLSRGKRALVTNKKLRHYKKGLEISSAFLDCDYFISIAKLKTHETERFTGVLKNQFGCLPRKVKDGFHPYLPEVVSDINMILKPDLGIIEGLVGMEGEGPNYGRPKCMNLMIAGDDPVLVDSVAAKVMGIDPYTVAIIKKAAERGLGVIHSEQSNLSSEKIEDVQCSFAFIPRGALFVHRLSLRVQRMGNGMNQVRNVFTSFGSQLEKLARALYSRSFTEIVSQKIPTYVNKKLRTPTKVVKMVLKTRLAFRK